MEIAVPLVALSGLYLISNQSKKTGSVNKYENFVNHESLPNTDIPNRNYPEEYPIRSNDIDQTSSLSKNNKFDSPSVYTDKYFNPNTNTLGSSETDYGSNTPGSTYYSLTGKMVDSNYFQHNNMVPYFGSHLRTQHAGVNSNESVLDNMNGTGSQLFTKKEQSPMFSPHDSLQWAYGAPNNTDFVQSRMNVSARMANVNPFKQEQVAPGLGLGYTTEGAGGFNSGMAMREQWLDRGVDDLRVANKPKSTEHMLLGYEGAAIHSITTRGELGIMEKNRPDTSFEMGQDRLFTTAVNKGPMLNSIPIDRYTTRPETTTSYSGIAGSQNPSIYVPGEYMPSHNIQLGEVPIGIANANGRYYANDGDYGIKSKVAYPNNRSVNQQDDYFGVVGGAIGAVIAPILDVIRPSRRENTIGTLRPYQNPGSTVSQSYIFNPADRPAHTIRETTENTKHNLGVNTNQHGGAYQVTQHQSVNTNRRTTDDYFYAGGSSAGERGREPRPYDAEYNQRNNDIKSSTIQGYMVKGNMSLLNSDMNIHSKAKESYLEQTRAIQPSMPYQTPDVGTFGTLQGSQSLYSNIQLDRNNSEVLSSLKSNPYALSVTSAF